MSNKHAKRQIRSAEAQQQRVQGQIDAFQRQDLVNPFANFESAAGNLTNPFANLRVNTTAAELQGARQDQNLANTLDAVRQGGGGTASTATAIAQQAAAANQNIAAQVGQQEQRNQQLAAQGQAQLQQFQAQSQDRAGQLRAQGVQYVQNLYEQRENQALAGLGNQLDLAQQSINAGYKSISDTNAAWIGFAGDIAGAAVGAATGGLFKGGGS